VVGCCERGNEPSVSKKPAEFLDYQRTAVGPCAARFQLSEEFVVTCLPARFVTSETSTLI
jgi:hypothetical protein